jgi:hypothetical protein
MNDPSHTFAKTGLGDHIRKVAMPIFATGRGITIASGTAVLIGPHRAITAYHVIEDLHRTFCDGSPQPGRAFSDYEILTYLEVGRNGETLNMKVGQFWRLAPYDIAILDLLVPADLPVDHQWIVPMITLLPPEINSAVYGFGFSKSEVTYPGDVHAEISHDPRTAGGRVIENHRLYRDQSRLNFPCFRTNARFDGGMSGGPVFTEKGCLCGLITSNLPPSQEGDEHVSYVSTLWPILATPIWVDGVCYRLFEWFQNKHFLAEDFTQFTFQKAETAMSLSIRGEIMLSIIEEDRG